jgi:hypothetical protein
MRYLYEVHNLKLKSRIMRIVAYFWPQVRISVPVTPLTNHVLNFFSHIMQEPEQYMPLQSAFWPGNLVRAKPTKTSWLMR